MGFPLAKIFKQALILTRNNKFLWGLGLFLIWGNLISFLSAQNSDQGTENGQQMANTSDMIHLTNAQINIWGTAIILVVAVLFVFYFLSRAGIILAVSQLMERRQVGFVKALSQARAYTLKVAGIWMLSGLSGLVVLAVLAAPIIYLYAEGFTERAAILGLIGLVIWVPVLLITGFANIFGVLFAVLFRTNIKDSFSSAFDLIGVYWWNLVLMEFGLFVINVAWFILSVFVSSLVLAPFVFLAKIPYDMVSQELNNPMLITGFTVVIVVFFWLQSIFASFQHTCWTLAFWEVVNGQKTEEAEEQPAPEVI